MRNYLAPIELRLQCLKAMAKRDPRSGPMLEEVDRIFNAVSQLRTLVSNLLDVARLDHGMFRLDPTVIDLVGVVEESARTLARPDTNIDLRVQSTGRIMVVADSARIRQCIDKLVANAVEQPPEGGTVTVQIATEKRAEGEYGRVQVIDEGPGVPPEILPRIFERHSTSKAGSGGLGLGLFLAKRIAELHGGELSVDSQLGKGARFALALPCQLHAVDAD